MVCRLMHRFISREIRLALIASRQTNPRRFIEALHNVGPSKIFIDHHIGVSVRSYVIVNALIRRLEFFSKSTFSSRISLVESSA